MRHYTHNKMLALLTCCCTFRTTCLQVARVWFFKNARLPVARGPFNGDWAHQSISRSTWRMVALCQQSVGLPTLHLTVVFYSSMQLFWVYAWTWMHITVTPGIQEVGLLFGYNGRHLGENFLADLTTCWREYPGRQTDRQVFLAAAHQSIITSTWRPTTKVAECQPTLGQWQNSSTVNSQTATGDKTIRFNLLLEQRQHMTCIKCAIFYC